MKAKSHTALGHYLVQQYLNQVPPIYVRAFLIGCIQPDRNPATYLKGSIRSQWLRGHNWDNAQRYMQRVSRRLEHCHKMRFWHFYTLGKLIHYTADAFTYAHNAGFTRSLKQHKEYEKALQRYFLNYVTHVPATPHQSISPLMDTIRFYHNHYIHERMDIRTDAHFTVTACCCIFMTLFSDKCTRQKPQN